MSPEIEKYLTVIERACAKIREIEGAGSPIKLGSNFSDKINVAKPVPVNRHKHVNDLMDMGNWPETVPHKLLVASEAEDHIKRANAILDSIVTKSLEGLNFLDFGCGEGWLVHQAVKRGANATGYDILNHNEWSSKDGEIYTNHFADLKDNYYDVVMLYDVLDHAEDPLEVMRQVKTIMRSDGTIYVKCHPWTSRHATHLFKQGLNKAYFHLFANYQEIAELIGQTPKFTRIEINPEVAYAWWFNDFEIVSKSLNKSSVEDFFKTPAMKKILANEQGIPHNKINDFLNIMEISFIDYCLVNR